MNLEEELQKMAQDENVPAHLRLGAMNRLADLRMAELKANGSGPGERPAAASEEPEDPMRDLDLIERARQLKLAGRLSSREFALWCDALNQGESLDDLEQRLDAVEARPKRAAGRRRGR